MKPLKNAENALGVSFVKADAVVFHKNPAECPALFSVVSVNFRPDLDHRRQAFPLKFKRIADQVQKQLTHLRRIAFNHRKIADLHPDLVTRLAREAEKASQHVLTMCIRALDYLPPVDVTFGDYLRALITADFDIMPDDSLGYRVAFMEAFRRRGIFPREARSLSEESLRWEGPDINIADVAPQVYLGRDLSHQMRDWNMSGNREVIFSQLQQARGIAQNIIDSSRGYKERITIGLDLDRFPFEVSSIRPVRRSGREGQFLMDAVVEITQKRPGCFDKTIDDALLAGASEHDFWFRGGCTLVIDLETGRLRYCIYKSINSADRYNRQRSYASGQYAGPSIAATYFDTASSDEVQEVFSFLHRGHGESV